MMTENSRAIAMNASSWPSPTSTSATDRRPSSDPANDALQQRDELSAHAPRGFHDLGVIERLRQDARGHVRDARDAQYIDAHVPRDDRLGNRRHPYRVGADRSEKANLRRRFVAGPEQPRIH